MSNFLSSDLLLKTLRCASLEEHLALTKSLSENAVRPLSPEKLQEQICLSAGYSVFNALRGEGVAYSQLLFDAAETLKVEKLKSRYGKFYKELSFSELDRLKSENTKEIPDNIRRIAVEAYVDDLERKLLAKLMSVAYESATPEQRVAVDAKLAAFAKTAEGKNLSGLPTSAALLVIGNLGGFATYTLMSALLSAMSLGTLGFGAYTFASSLLSVVLGPAGWLMLGAYSAVKLVGQIKDKLSVWPPPVP